MPVTTPPAAVRSSHPLATPGVRRRYWALLTALLALSALFAFGLLAWDNPMPVGTEGFWIIARMRATSVVVILVVAFCQAIATVSFQTATNNRIITPSIMGFESLYRAVQTSSVYFLGVAGITAIQGVSQFLLQVALMVGFALLLYGWLLSGRYGNLQVMLLVGIILGARLFGSISHADPAYLPYAIPLAAIAGGALWANAKNLNLLSLGRDAATSLGLNHRRQTMVTLFFVSILMAVSTALVGPMTFLGFLVATLAYQLADTYDHRYIFPMSVATAFIVLTGSYFVMKHVFYAQGVVSVIIELVGGGVFLLVLLRKGRL
jgi:iron complex transport system permease protein